MKFFAAGRGAGKTYWLLAQMKQDIEVGIDPLMIVPDAEAIDWVMAHAARSFPDVFSEDHFAAAETWQPTWDGRPTYVDNVVEVVMELLKCNVIAMTARHPDTLGRTPGEASRLLSAVVDDE